MDNATLATLQQFGQSLASEPGEPTLEEIQAQHAADELRMENLQRRLQSALYSLVRVNEQIERIAIDRQAQILRREGMGGLRSLYHGQERSFDDMRRWIHDCWQDKFIDAPDPESVVIEIEEVLREAQEELARTSRPSE